MFNKLQVLAVQDGMLEAHLFKSVVNNRVSDLVIGMLIVLSDL